MKKDLIDDLPTVGQLVRVLQKLPYLASKNVYRVVDYILRLDSTDVDRLCTILRMTKEHITHCRQCFSWQERERCVFCSSELRKKNVVCVVASWHEILALERSGGYDGVYHVLGGVISPLEGVNACDLTIDMLIDRVKNTAVDEVICALDQTPEGEATIAFLSRKLKGISVKVTCLARGLPVGSSIESMDRLTLYKALAERRALG